MSTNTKIDTGKPGFVIDSDDVIDANLAGIYVYDVGESNRPNDPNYPDTDTSTKTGAINVDNSTTRDLSNQTKVTLANYLGKKTQVNYYNIDKEAIDVSLTSKTNKNETPTLTNVPAQRSRNVWFTTGKTNIGGVVAESPELKKWVIPDTSQDVLPELSKLVKKGKLSGGDTTALTGNQLLPGIEGVAKEKVVRYTNAVLSNNRFTNSTRYVPNESDTSDTTTPVDLGAVARSGRYNPVFHHPVFGDITANRMAQLATSLALRASQELNSLANGNNPSSPTTAANSLLPGANQLGTKKVDLINLEAADAIRTLTKEEIPESQHTSIADGSWGALNNSLDEYSGMSSAGMTTLAITLSAMVSAAIETISGLITLIPNDDTNSVLKNRSTSMSLGRSIKNDSSDSTYDFFKQMTGITSTTYPYAKAVERGNRVFFGLDTNKKFLSAAGETAINMMKSSGQIVTIARSIIRSSLNVFQSISSISGGFTPATKSILSIIDVIAQSKVIAAMNMFAIIGDAALMHDYYYDVTIRTDGEVISQPHSAIKKSWQSGRAPSLLLSSTPIFLQSCTSQDLGSNLHTETLQSTGETRTRTYYKIGNQNRIPHGSSTEDAGIQDPQTLMAIEKLLDSEYVPFYFHDVRTNEVISFHAFLSSLSDDYAASYDSVEGIGRVEPVKIYKGTQRKISMSFHVVATNDNDFDHMWTKINKLVTLVYPQYTEGKRLTDKDGNSYIQPFSQMIGASPMIRIRLGNLIRSNYSRFALARLFGSTLKDTTIKSVKNTDVNKEVESAKNRKSSDDEYWILKPSIYHQAGMQKEGTNKFLDAVKDNSRLPVKIITGADNSGTLSFELVDVDKLDDSYIKSPISSQGTRYYLKTKYSENYSQKYLASKDDLSPTEQLKEKLTKVAFEKNQGESEILSLSDFMNPEKNSLVKSFISAGGKGLAGFIESINFDWHENVNWDVSPGRVAPQMCKVTLAFSPIHDITPGIDSQGINRAPVYPVGPFRQSDDPTM